MQLVSRKICENNAKKLCGASHNIVQKENFFKLVGLGGIRVENELTAAHIR